MWYDPNCVQPGEVQWKVGPAALQFAMVQNLVHVPASTVIASQYGRIVGQEFPLLCSLHVHLVVVQQQLDVG